MKNCVVESSNKKFKAIVFESSDEMSNGLQGLKLPVDECAVFDFKRPGLRSFAMKNVSYPLDMIFLNGEKVVKIVEGVQVGDEKIYTALCTCVIECCAGFCANNFINVGSHLIIRG